MDEDARRWIAASALIGFGQQVYVVLRNQLLHDLHLSMALLGVVQGMGAVTGVVAGVAGLSLLPKRPAAWTLRAGALANAVKFAAQVGATQAWQFVLGAALAGFGIQTLTMASGPFLARRVTDHDRVRTYALQMIAIQTAPGLLGAVLGGELQRVAASYGTAVGVHRVALAVGATSVALALLPLRRLSGDDAPRRDARSLRLSELRRFAVFLAPDAVLYFGAGLAVPFLQVHLQVAYGAAPHHVGWYFGAMMVAGTLGNLTVPQVARRIGNIPALTLLQVGVAAGFAGLATASTVGGAVAALVARYACSVTAIPLWTAALHAALPPQDGEVAASWRMLTQSVAWAAANLLAAAALTEGADALRGLFLAAAVTQVLAAWACRRGLAALARRREADVNRGGAPLTAAPEPHHGGFMITRSAITAVLVAATTACAQEGSTVQAGSKIYVADEDGGTLSVIDHAATSAFDAKRSRVGARRVVGKYPREASGLSVPEAPERVRRWWGSSW